MSFRIRPARREDAETVLNLIEELNEYQDIPPCKITLDSLRRDLFECEQPWARVNLAVVPSPVGGEVVVGHALYVVIFDAVTLQRVAYMEDVYVRPAHRRQGIGLALWKSVVEQGLREGCDASRLEVLGWNKEAVGFYAKHGAKDLTPAYNFQHHKLTWDVPV
uniref:N-acetyltransferase domain-containing protein n=1 Tax=Amblyomma maculatum TaxID=34609 RepID=G3MS24_AMBMU